MGVNNIPLFKIGNKRISLFQGGMGVGVSLSGLASAVAEEGGAGIIASVGIGVLKGYYDYELEQNKEKIENAGPEERKAIIETIYKRTNQYALREEIRLARRKTNGVIGINIMHALSDYVDLVDAALEEDIDFIISGAGIPRDLPSRLNGKDVNLIPIVSSADLAEKMCRGWNRYEHLPDAIVVEGPKAGGHLGYCRRNPEKPEILDNLDNPEFVENGLERIVKEVIEVVKPFRKNREDIPVIAAGGIFYGGDIRKAVEDWGVSGVQMATRFVATEECDVDYRFKQAYLECKREDIILINSPVGMPGRAIRNSFLTRLQDSEKKESFRCDYKCLRWCKQLDSKYCIANALVDAQHGIFDKGYTFCGTNAYLCKEIVPVKQLFSDIDREYGENIRSD